MITERQKSIFHLSDTILYREALDFIREQGTVDGHSQMSSLTSYTQSWRDLTEFVSHQNRRDWLGRKAYYKQFYSALEAYLNNLRSRIRDEWFPPDANLTKRQTKDWLDEHGILLAREFIQHLAAENLYREAIQ